MRYKLLRKIGEGGFGEVFEAADQSGAKYAVKIAKKSVPNSRERLLNQFRCLARAHHRRIVRVYDFDPLAQDGPMLVTEFFDGDDLKTYVSKNGADDLPEIVAMVLDALGYLHRLGQIHGDIKPQSILVCKREDGVDVRLIDAGLNPVKANGLPMIQGTPRYMAPEIITGSNVDGRSDLFSLGITLIEALAGRIPYDASSLDEILAIYTNKAIDFEEDLREASPLWRDFIRGLVRINRDERFRDASKAGLELEKIFARAGLFVGNISLPHCADLVGRDEEINRILSRLDSPTDGLVVIEGSAGSGVTRMLWEVANLALERGLIVDRFWCRPGASLVMHLISLARQIDPTFEFVDQGGEILKSDYFSDITLAIECILSDRRRHLLVIDDLDLLSPRERDLIGFLSRKCGKDIIVICGSHSRSDMVSTGKFLIADRVHLAPLGIEATEKMICSLLPSSGLPPRLVESIYSKTRGNPRLIDETVRHLFASGSVTFKGSGSDLRVGWNDQTVVPDEATLLQDRIEDLDDDAKYILLASIISGCGISAEEARELVGDRWLVAIDNLRERGLIRDSCEVGSIEPVCHTDLSEIYKVFGEDTIADVGLRFASILERKKEGQNCYRAGLVYSAIGRKQAALRRLIEAGDLLLPSSRAAAYDAYQKALPCTDDEMLRQELHEKLGDISLSYDDLIEAIDHFSKAKQRPSARRKFAWVTGLKGDYDEAIRLLQECESLALSSGDQIEYARTLTDLGYIMVLASRISEGIDLLRKAYQVFVSLSMHADAGRTLNRIGIAYNRMSDFGSAIEAYRIARMEYERGGDYRNAAVTAVGEALCLRKKMEFEKAKDLIESAKQTFERLRSPYGLAGCYHALAQVLTDLGNLDQAVWNAEKALNLNQILGTSVGEVVATTLLAGIELEKGNWVECEKKLRGLESSGHKPTKYHQMIIKRYLSRSAGLRGDFDTALRLAEESYDLACSVDDGEGKGQALIEKARALLAKGDRDQAIQVAEQACSLLEASSSQIHGNQARALLGEALIEAGRIDEALNQIEEAKLGFERFPSSIYFGRVSYLLARAFLAKGDLVTFWSNLTSAIEVFYRSGAHYDLGKALLEGGKVCLGQGNLVKAKNYLSEAERIFGEIHIDTLKQEAMSAMGKGLGSGFESNAISALGRIAEALNSSKDITSVLNTAMDLAVEYLGAERGVIFLEDEASGDLTAVVQRKMDRQSIDDALDVSRSIVESVRSTGQAVVLSDASKDPRFQSSKSIVMYNIRGVIAVPLRVGKKLIGIIYLDSRTAPYGPDEISKTFVEVFANQVALAISNAYFFTRLYSDLVDLKLRAGDRYSYKNIIGPGNRMQEVFRQVEKAAKSKISVLLVGESGTGKELIAGLLHQLSPRCDKPYVVVDFGAIAKDLVESELFGIEGRVATGVSARAGVFERANGGTIFLDEIGDMPVAMQTKILRVLSEQEFTRVGGSRKIKVDVRIISATNRDLKKLIREGLFREDLYYRLNGMQIHLPPLRDRIEDLPALVEYFVAKYCHQNSKPLMRVSPEVLGALSRYRWPGNIRELEKCLEYAVVTADGDQIEIEHLPREILDSLRLEQEALQGPSLHPSLSKAVESLEKKMIIDALMKANFVQTKAARILGINESTLRKKMKTYGIRKEVLKSRK